jgi:hypothetical protein
LEAGWLLLRYIINITASTTTPDTNLIMVKLAASIKFPPNANLHRIEFPAKANKAKLVQTRVLKVNIITLRALSLFIIVV